MGPLPSEKHKWHIDNALDTKITAGVVHNGERGFHIHIVWLYSSSISRSYRGFTDFCDIWSGTPRLNTARVGMDRKVKVKNTFPRPYFPPRRFQGQYARPGHGRARTPQFLLFRQRTRCCQCCRLRLAQRRLKSLCVTFGTFG